MTAEKIKENKSKTSDKKLSKKEIEAKIVELAKKDNMPSSKIGLTMKQKYGVGKVRKEGIKVEKILSKNKIERAPEELENLIQRATKLRSHLLKNKQDKVAKRGLQLTEARVRKLAKYFKSKGKIKEDWAYKPAK